MAKPLLKVETIYDAAIDIAEQLGPEQLTIRQLTQSLRCSPNTLYSQIGNRDDLIQGMLSYFFTANAAELAAEANWQEHCRDWANDFHRLLVENPHLARLIGWRQRPAITARVNVLLVKLIDAGFEMEFALRCVRVLSHETISLSLMEIESPAVKVRRQNRSSKECVLEQKIRDSVKLQSLVESRPANGSVVDIDTEEFQNQGEIFSSAMEFTLRGIEAVYQELDQKKD